MRATDATGLGPDGGRLTPARRQAVGRLASTLIGDWDGMPTVTEARVDTVWIDEVLAYRRDVEDEVLGLLDAAGGGDPRKFLEGLKESAPLSHGLLVAILTAAYLMNPEVAARIGDPIQAARVVDPAEYQRYLDEGLLNPVTERGAVYRPTP